MAPWIPFPNQEATNRQRKAFVLNNYLLKSLFSKMECGITFGIISMTFLFDLYVMKEMVT